MSAHRKNEFAKVFKNLIRYIVYISNNFVGLLVPNNYVRYSN